MDRRWDKSKPPRGPFTVNRDCPQAAGLVGWWPMGGPSGAKLVFDHVGKAHLAGTTSPPTLGPTGAPNCVFNGSSDVLTAAAAPVTAMPLTLAGWATAGSASLVGSILSIDAGLAAFGSANFYRLVVVGSASPKQVRANQGESASEVQATYGAGWVAGREFHAAGVFSGVASRDVYYNGALGASDTTNLTAPTVSQTVLGRHSVTGSEQYWAGNLGEAGVWAVALPAHIIARLSDPGTRFELWYPLRGKRWISLGGGTTLNATLIDAAAAADILSASSILNATLVDASAGADIASATATRNATLTDAAAGDDLRSALSTLVASLMEGTSGSDLASTSSAVTASLVEGASAVDLAAAVATLNAQLTDGVSAADLLTASMVAHVAATEAAAASDTASTGTTFSGSLVDAAAAAEVLATAATMVVQVLEAGAGVDQLTAAQQLVVLLTESAAGTDLASGTKPAAYSVTVVELAAALDVLSGVLSTSLGLLAGRRRVVMPMLALTRRRVAMRAATGGGRSVTMYPV